MPSLLRASTDALIIYLKLCVALSVEFERLCKVVNRHCKTYVSPFQCSISSTQVLCCIVNLPIYTKQMQGVFGKPGTSLRHVRVDIYNAVVPRIIMLESYFKKIYICY